MSLQKYFYCYPKPEYGLLVCKDHHHAVLPQSIGGHLSSLSHTGQLSPFERSAIQEEVNQVAHQYHATYEEIQIPSHPIPAIRGLALHLGSLRCLECEIICTGVSARKNMKSHLREVHHIEAPPAGSITSAQRLSFWSRHWNEITTQQFFSRIPGDAPSRGQQHFEVLVNLKKKPRSAHTERASGSASDLVNTSDISSHNIDKPKNPAVEKLFADYNAADQTHEKQCTLQAAQVPEAPERQTNPYLEHTKFQQCLEGLTWGEARLYTGLGTDPKAQYLVDSVKSTILVYQCIVAITSRWARIRVMQENTKDIPKSPLVHYQSFSLHHSVVVSKIFLFFYHIHVDRYAYPSTLPRFTTAQQQAWLAITVFLDTLPAIPPKVSLDHRRTTLQPFERLCHTFWMSLVEQTTVCDDFQLSLITPLAFIAVDSNKDSFRPAYLFATDLSAIKKIMRFAACQKFWDESEASIKTCAQKELVEQDTLDSDPDIDPGEAASLIIEQDNYEKTQSSCAVHEDSARAENDRFREWVYQYLSERYNTPMSWVMTTAQYISRIRYGETLDAFVRWNGPVVTVKDVSTTFDHFQALVWSLQNQAEDVLLQLAFTEKLVNLPSIPWERVACDPSRTEPGYSPLSKLEVYGRCKKNFILHQMANAICDQKFTRTTFQLDNHSRIVQYGKRVQEFLQVLFQLIYFTSGQPPRLSELLSAQIENSVNDGPRNFFMYEGLVALVLRYHKGYNRDKSLKIIYRYLPEKVASLLVWYCSLIRPFWQVITARQNETKEHPHYWQARSPFLWSDNQGEQYKDARSQASALQLSTINHLGVAVGPQLMRHLMIAFGRKLDQERGKGTAGNIQILDEEELEEALEEQDNDYRELQAGHTPNTAVAVYASTMAAVFRMRFSAPEAYLKISTRWHADLGYKTRMPLARSLNPRLDKITCTTDRISRRQNVNILAVLQENFGLRARFRGEQEKVLQAILDCDPAVVYIAGTGSGKSLVFLLPACCEGYGQAVLIAPLVALREDIVKRCQQLAITCSQWGDTRFNETSRIILAMPEHLDQPRFVSLVKRLYDMGRLERIVIDEFHYVLLPDHQYRPSLLRLQEVAQYHVPLTLLSATIPYSSEKQAYSALGIQEIVTVFRESTSRPNLAYEVSTMPSHVNVQSIKILEYLAQQRQLLGKVLVYVPQRNLVEWLAEHLACLRYHGAMKEEDRNAAQQAFLACEFGLMIATTAFNAGVHIPDIRAVIRLGEPDHPITWSQEGGRGGRDGKRCVVRIVLGAKFPSFFPKLGPNEKKVLNQIMLRDASVDATCMRVTIDSYFDGPTGRTNCYPAEELCQFCAKRQPASENRAFSGAAVDSLGFDAEDDSVSSNKAHSSPTAAIAPKTPAKGAGSLTAASPASYELSSPPVWFPRTLASPCINGHQTPTPSVTGSPAKRHRHQVSVSEVSSPLSSRGGDTSAKTARIERKLEYMGSKVTERQQDAARVHAEIKQTAEYWRDHCVACFVAHRRFDHVKDTEDCDYTSDLASYFRREMMQNGKFSRGYCWACLFPRSLCRRYLGPDGSTRLQPSRDASCTYSHIMLDVWATLWAACPSIRSQWIARIAAYNPNLRGENKLDFHAYFLNNKVFAKPLGEVSFITWDVHHFTQHYFLQEGDKWEDIWRQDKAMTIEEALDMMHQTIDKPSR